MNSLRGERADSGLTTWVRSASIGAYCSTRESLRERYGLLEGESGVLAFARRREGRRAPPSSAVPVAAGAGAAEGSFIGLGTGDAGSGGGGAGASGGEGAAGGGATEGDLADGAGGSGGW
ncbi:MAG: hypothetical protein ACREEC_00590 [Thermoplasmata archaeon]